MKDKIDVLKGKIISIGRLLWEKNLVSGLNGNISVRVDDNSLLLTGTQTCLGLLNEDDIFLTNLNGEVIGEGKVSTEKPMHIAVYKNFPEISAVIHSHTPYTNGFFIEKNIFEPKTYESLHYIGRVEGLPQNSINVSDIDSLISALKRNKIVALKHHGVLAMGLELFDCYVKIQALEDAIIVDSVSKLYKD